MTICIHEVVQPNIIALSLCMPFPTFYRHNLITTDPNARKSKTAMWFLEEKTRIFSAMDTVYSTVANLTQWADRLSSFYILL